MASVVAHKFGSWSGHCTECTILLNSLKVIVTTLRLQILYIKVNLCVFVCVSSIEIHTVGPILTKFGMGA